MTRSINVYAILLLLSATSLLRGQVPEPVPGLKVPERDIPYALDHFNGNPQLIPVHHSAVEINNHKGANVAGSLAGSFFYKPKMSFEVAGEHSRTTLHDLQPVFYLRVLQDPDGGDETADNEPTVFAIVTAVPDKDRRVFAKVRFTQLTGNAKRNDGSVDSATERLPGGWLKITPRSPLAPGEYALTPIPKAQNAFSSVVFDFAIAPSAANPADAILPKK